MEFRFHSRARFIPAAVVVVLCTGVLAAATSNEYSSTSLDDDIRKSCKDLSLSGTTLNGTCNKSDGTTNAASIDLNSYLICQNNTHEIIWTHSQTPGVSTSALSTTTSRGLEVTTDYFSEFIFYATCDAAQGRVDINLRKHIRNSTTAGNFEYTSTSQL